MSTINQIMLPVSEVSELSSHARGELVKSLYDVAGVCHEAMASGPECIALSETDFEEPALSSSASSTTTASFRVTASSVEDSSTHPRHRQTVVEASPGSVCQNPSAFCHPNSRFPHRIVPLSCPSHRITHTHNVPHTHIIRTPRIHTSHMHHTLNTHTAIPFLPSAQHQPLTPLHIDTDSYASLQVAECRLASTCWQEDPAYARLLSPGPSEAGGV
ncbi:unnamed protein product, partial [Protopolystoma xenopodis]